MPPSLSLISILPSASASLPIIISSLTSAHIIASIPPSPKLIVRFSTLWMNMDSDAVAWHGGGSNADNPGDALPVACAANFATWHFLMRGIVFHFTLAARLHAFCRHMPFLRALCVCLRLLLLPFALCAGLLRALRTHAPWLHTLPTWKQISFSPFVQQLATPLVVYMGSGGWFCCARSSRRRILTNHSGVILLAIAMLRHLCTGRAWLTLPPPAAAHHAACWHTIPHYRHSLPYCLGPLRLCLFCATRASRYCVALCHTPYRTFTARLPLLCTTAIPSHYYALPPFICRHDTLVKNNTYRTLPRTHRTRRARVVRYLRACAKTPAYRCSFLPAQHFTLLPLRTPARAHTALPPRLHPRA